jgi:hypothetical protein
MTTSFSILSIHSIILLDAKERAQYDLESNQQRQTEAVPDAAGTRTSATGAQATLSLSSGHNLSFQIPAINPELPHSPT